jgi:transposase-like protein
VRGEGNTAASVAHDLDLTETTVREWVKQPDVDNGRRDGLTTAEREELARLRKELRVLREERDILKRGGCRTKFCSSSVQPSASGPVAR